MGRGCQSRGRFSPDVARQCRDQCHGIFNPAKLPAIKGLEDFAGPWFHTSQWPDDIELTGKRVAIIGNGASAMQIGPEIQNQPASLTIFQRSPHWAAPFEMFRRPVAEPVRFLLREVPLYQSWYRMRLGWTFNDRVHRALKKDPDWPHAERSLNAINDGHREYFTRYITSELESRPDLLDKVVPTYPPFGKRMLMDNGWYRMLTNERVELVADPIAEIRPDRIVTEDGTEYETDVLIVATGFDVLRFMTAFDVRGRSGRSLRDVWDDDDARAYLGLAIPGFPNFFCLYGPNTQPGHGGSLIFVVEMQMHTSWTCCGRWPPRASPPSSAARTSTTATTRPSTRPTSTWSGPTRAWRPTTATPGDGGGQLPVPQRRPVCHDARAALADFTTEAPGETPAVAPQTDRSVVRPNPPCPLRPALGRRVPA